MGKIKVYAGDFINGGTPASYNFGVFTLCSEKHKWMGEHILGSKIKEIDVASEESVKRIGGTVGWGVAGGVLLGPVGLLTGLLLGGRGKDVTFVVQFFDGRKLLGTTDQKTFNAMRIEALKAKM